jgi:hypothetical protein
MSFPEAHGLMGRTRGVYVVRLTLDKLRPSYTLVFEGSSTNGSGSTKDGTRGRWEWG